MAYSHLHQRQAEAQAEQAKLAASEAAIL